MHWRGWGADQEEDSSPHKEVVTSSSQGEEREKAKIMLDIGLGPGWMVRPFRRKAETEREVEAKFGRKGWVDSGRRRAEKPMS